MVAPDSASQGGRSTRRAAGTTPVRDVSPSQRVTRSGSVMLETTPQTRRSTRAASRLPEVTNNTIANPALPVIQTRQSYAYGASRAPMLPEQLHARETLSTGQIISQMDSAMQRAEQNLRERAGEKNHSKNIVDTKSKNAENSRAEVKSTKGPSKLKNTEKQKQSKHLVVRGESPTSQTTEKQKHQRTAAWASSLESSQLDNISEESSDHPSSPVTHATEPSSFPSGIFDHSYNYERGVRGPRVEPRPVLRTFFRNSYNKIRSCCSNIYASLIRAENAVADLLWRYAKVFGKILFELPESALVAALTKGIMVLGLCLALSLISCFVYKTSFCDPLATSPLSQTLQRFCGTCTDTYYLPVSYTAGGHNDLGQLTAAIRNINNQIKLIETRLGQRIDSTHTSMQTEIDSLRKQQNDLGELLKKTGHQQHSESEVPSPFIPKVNWFSPGMNAFIIPHYTSPTNERLSWLPGRIVLSLFGFKRYESNGPLTALLPWQDVGDCWCASSTSSEYDRIRIGVEVKELIYPTELVIEHAPEGSTLTHASAPRDLELWADFSHLTAKQWAELGIESMQKDRAGVKHPIRGVASFAKIADVVYDATSGAHHVQRFKLAVNQFGDLSYAAKSFVVRARTSYGANYSCLYRLRLHGVPVADHGEESDTHAALTD